MMFVDNINRKYVQSKNVLNNVDMSSLREPWQKVKFIQAEG